ncbi:MAG TPA: hypothetical protein VJB57_19455 [Dehalococcoidia bacterium]|nr:hypothetical protein [Dehalococcoidia bacterium]
MRRRCRSCCAARAKNVLLVILLTSGTPLVASGQQQRLGFMILDLRDVPGGARAIEVVGLT